MHVFPIVVQHIPLKAMILTNLNARLDFNKFKFVVYKKVSL
jgi:hypothetical protein